MNKLTHIDLFSGIGGFALAADWTWGKENIDHVFCEIEPFAQKVLKKHWPDAPIHSDIKEFKYDGANPFILTGGFPCQPFSVAGKQRGKEDDRALWPEMLRVIQETRPRWIVGENVSGFVKMELDNCLSDLEGAGYDCQPMVIPACAVDAKHRRDRVWIVGNSNISESGEIRRDDAEVCGLQNAKCGAKNSTSLSGGAGEVMADSKTIYAQGFTYRQGSIEPGRSSRWTIEPAVGRVANGIPARVDRLKGLGNAIAPQVAQAIMQCIKQIEETPEAVKVILNDRR